MGNEADIKIALKTTGDTSGADQVADSLENVKEKEQSLQEQRNARVQGAAYDNPSLDLEAEAKRKLREETRRLEQEEQDLVDAEYKQAKAVQDAADVIEAKRRVSERSLTMQSGQIKNMGHVANQVGYQVTDFAVQVQGGTSALVALSQQVPQALGALTMLGGGVKSLSGIMSVSVGIMTPLTLVLTELTVGGKMTADAYEGMRKAQDDLAASTRRHAEELVYMREQQLKLDQQTNRDFLAQVYSDEAGQLEREVKAMERINQLRGELNNIEQQRANQQVAIAKQHAGETDVNGRPLYDVASAEANALAVQLKTGLEALDAELSTAAEKAKQAEIKANQAFGTYQNAIATGADPAKIDELAKLVDSSRQEAGDAKQALSDSTAKYKAARLAYLEKFEIDFTDKESEYSGKMSATAQKGFDAVYNSLKDAVSEGPKAAIAQIQVEAGSVSTAATDKATEVQNSLATERTNTVQSIQSIAPTPQDTAAMTGAVQSVGTALEEQSNAVISALANLASLVSLLTGRVGTQQAQIDQLMARIR
jgi:hypothetical protein